MTDSQVCELFNVPLQLISPKVIDLETIFEKNRLWSLKTFGEGSNTKGVLAHLRDELNEVEQEESGSKEQLLEWCDVILLAFNGACRSGFTVDEVTEALHEKVTYNSTRNSLKKYKENGSIEILVREFQEENK